MADYVADYVVVGGGSAGAVLASRLSEDPDRQILLIEAGGDARSLIVQLPIGFAKMLLQDKFDWQYQQDADPTLNGRRWVWHAGRMLGGGSSLNGQVFIRGIPRDFDEWAKAGATGWSYADVLPYFLRSEHWSGSPSQARGGTGPVAVSPIRDPHPLCHTFLDACGSIGLPTLDDHNDGSAFGAFLTQTNQDKGWRCSTEKAYLRPNRDRANLRIITDAEVKTITINDGRVTGVMFERAGQSQRAEAKAEVCLCAGVLGSPALLMRSGIGPAADLRERGIAVVYDAPEVGRNLQEHSAAGISRFVNVPTYNSQVGPLDMVRHIARFAWNRTGPMSSPAVQAMAYAKTRDDLDQPDVQLHFTPLAHSFTADTTSPAEVEMPKQPAVTINASLCQPKGRGRVELDAQGHPRVNHQLLGDPRDVACLVGGMKLIERIFDSPAMQAATVGRRAPLALPQNDEAWIDHLRANTMITWHGVGTCRMGSDDAAVVDPALRLRGLRGLRVIDASIMPTTPSSNTNAASIMIGEKGADMIRQAERA